MNPMIPNKSGWWWLEDKPVEVELYEDRLVTRVLSNITWEGLHYQSHYEYVDVLDLHGWRGPCVRLGPYDMIVTVPELAKRVDCTLTCILSRCDYTVDGDPGPGCPRYEEGK